MDRVTQKVHIAMLVSHDVYRAKKLTSRCTIEAPELCWWGLLTCRRRSATGAVLAQPVEASTAGSRQHTRPHAARVRPPCTRAPACSFCAESPPVANGLLLTHVFAAPLKPHNGLQEGVRPAAVGVWRANCAAVATRRPAVVRLMRRVGVGGAAVPVQPGCCCAHAWECMCLCRRHSASRKLWRFTVAMV